MKVILRTERLILRELEVGDASFLLRIVNTPGWLRYIGDRQVYKLDDAEAYLLKGPLASYRQYGFGFYGVVLKGTGRLIGMCGLARREELDDVDIGFAFLPGYTGHGYALEAAMATMDYARDELQLKRIIAITTPDNERSIRLLKKIGLVEEGKVRYSGEELLLFGIDFR